VNELNLLNSFDRHLQFGQFGATFIISFDTHILSNCCCLKFFLLHSSVLILLSLAVLLLHFFLKSVFQESGLMMHLNNLGLHSYLLLFSEELLRQFRMRFQIMATLAQSH